MKEKEVSTSMTASPPAMEMEVQTHLLVYNFVIEINASDRSNDQGGGIGCFDGRHQEKRQMSSSPSLFDRTFALSENSHPEQNFLAKNGRNRLDRSYRCFRHERKNSHRRLLFKIQQKPLSNDALTSKERYPTYAIDFRNDEIAIIFGESL